MSPVSQTIELLIVILMLTGIGIAGLLATWGLRGRTAAEYFLAGRSMGWLALGSSLAVTTLWGVWLLFEGMKLTDARSMILLGAVAAGGLIMLGVAFAPAYRESNASTLPEFLRQRYGSQVAASVSVVSILLTLLVRIPLTILIGSRLLNAVLGWGFMSSALLMIIVPGLFVVAGGYRAVIVAQGAGGVAAFLGMLFLAFNGPPLDAVAREAAMAVGEPLMPIVGGFVVLGIWFTCIDQFVTQRACAARSTADIRNGGALAALLVVVGIALLATRYLAGEFAAPVHTDSGVAMGFIGSAVIAFSMASLSGHFMSISTLFTMDLFAAGRKKNDGALVLSGRLTGAAVVVFAILAASSLALIDTGGLEWMMRVAVAAVPPMAAVTLVGMLWPRMHGRGALWALAAGWTFGLVQAALGADAVAGYMQSALVAFAGSAVVFVAVSLASSPLGSLGTLPGGMLEKGLPKP